MDDAKEIVLNVLDNGTIITAELEHGEDYLFFAIRPDRLEGRFDPFVKVNKNTGKFSDWSPHDYPNSREILDPMIEQGIETSKKL